ncbi:hypothetical protein ACHAXS_014253 [Conticribra weissflogii]
MNHHHHDDDDDDVEAESAFYQDDNVNDNGDGNDNHDDDDDDDDEEHTPPPPPAAATIHHLAAFSVLGLSLRVFLVRLLGGDCALSSSSASSSSSPIDDWLTPLSRTVCVTSPDSALFLDLPANMLGSFLLGLFADPPSRSSDGGSSIAWPSSCLALPPRHRAAFLVGIRTGLCGTVTTFSSWNSQMVGLMVGTASQRQVVGALFGYLLGTMGGTGSFRVGRTVAARWAWRRKRKQWRPKRSEVEGEEHAEMEEGHPDVACIAATATLVAPTVLSLVLLALYLLGDVRWNIPFYRRLWMASLLSPLGTYCRWKLSSFNNSRVSFPKCRRRPPSPHKPPAWFPLGTFLANLSGSLVSAAIAAVLTSSSFRDRDYDDTSWTTSVLAALSLGFAGGLSTVSTFVKELVELSEGRPAHENKAFGYWVGTVGGCGVVGLVVYGSLVRGL